MNVIEIPQVVLPQNPSDAHILNALENEAIQIISKIPKNSYVIPLCIEGKQYSSEEFAKVIEDNQNFGGGSIVFIIGSSYGLSKTVKEMANLRLSMSKMTFPHRLARIMLLEQVYRGYKIIQGSTYHK